MNDLNLRTLEWANSLSGYNGRGADANEMFKICLGIVNLRSDLEITVLEKVKRGFSDFKSYQITVQTGLRNELDSSFAGRFSKWAKEHPLVAKILVFITLGWLGKVWDQGEQLRNQEQNVASHLQTLDSYAAVIRQELIRKKIEVEVEILAKRKIENDPTSILDEIISYLPVEERRVLKEGEKEEIREPYSSSILGTIFTFLSSDERKVLMEWEEAKKAMEQADNYKWELLKNLKAKYKALLNTGEFSFELRRLEEMDHDIPPAEGFTFLEYGVGDKEQLIINYIFHLIFDKWRKKEIPEKVKKLLNDRDFALTCISKFFAMEFVPDVFKTDRAFVLEALMKRGEFLKELSKEMQNDRELVLTAIRRDGHAFKHASEELQRDKQLVLESLQEHCYHALKIVKDFDREVAYAAVCANGFSLECIPKKFRDEELVIAALLKNGAAFQCCTEEEKQNRNFALAAVKNFGEALGLLPDNMKEDKEIVTEAVKNYGLSIQYASEKLKNDRDIALEAVKQNGSALEKLRKFSGDREIVEIAIRTHHSEYGILGCVDYQLRCDEKILLAAVQKRGRDLQYASEELKKNKKVVLAAITQNGCALEYADPIFQKDREMVAFAIKSDGFALRYASSDLRADYDLALEAVSKDHGNVLPYVSEKLRDNDVIIKAAIAAQTRRVGNNIFYASDRIKSDKTIALLAVKKNGEALQYLLGNLRSDREVVWEAVNQTRGHYHFRHASLLLQADPQIWQAAIEAQME